MKKGGATGDLVEEYLIQLLSEAVSSKQKTRNKVRGYSRRLRGSRMGGWLGRAFWRETRTGGQVVARVEPHLSL